MDFQQATEAATGAPGVVRVGDAEWLVDQPTPADFLALRAWVRARLKSPIAALAEKIRLLPPELQVAALHAAVELDASGSEVTADGIQQVLATPEGCAWWLWMLARKQQLWCAPKDFLPHLNGDNVHAVLADLYAASGMGGVEKNSDRGPSGS
jgi:hypothetical protein